MEDREKFDVLVTHRDPQSGVVTGQNPYNLIVTGEGRKRLFERPKNSGNVFDSKGHAAGRWVRDENGKGKHEPLAEHVAVKPALTKEESANFVLSEKETEIAALKKELAAVRAESAPKQDKPKAPAKADKV